MNLESPRLRRLPIEPWRPTFRPRRHDDACLDRFVDASMQLLERTGVRVLSERAAAVSREHGAAWDVERQVARLSEDLVRGARERALHILEDYQPEPLDEAKAVELRRILAVADAEIKS